jgi:hypothetical protein
LLLSADRFNDAAICFGLVRLNMLFSRSRASLRCVTEADHLFLAFFLVFFLVMTPGFFLLS